MGAHRAVKDLACGAARAIAQPSRQRGRHARRRSRAAGAAALIALVLCAVAPAVATAATAYSFSDLSSGSDTAGKLVSGASISAVNDSGDAVGSAFFSDSTGLVGAHGFLYGSKDGVFHELKGVPPPQFSAGTRTFAVDVNDNDDVAGTEALGTNNTGAGDSHVMFWPGGSATPIDPGEVANPGRPSVFAAAINSAGVIIGTGQDNNLRDQAVESNRGGPLTELTNTPTDFYGGDGISDGGLTAMTLSKNGGTQISSVGSTTLPFILTTTHALSHNGRYAVGQGRNPFVGEELTPSGTITLPPLAGDVSSDALGVNDSGDAVGWSQGQSGQTVRLAAVIWHDGAPTDLNTLVLNLPYKLVQATGISDSGYIVGDGRGSTVNVAPLWRLKPTAPGCPIGAAPDRRGAHAAAAGTAISLIGSSRVTLDATTGGTLCVTGEVRSAQALAGAGVRIDLSPGSAFGDASQFANLSADTGTLTKSVDVSAGGTDDSATFTGLKVDSVVVRDGFTIRGMNAWMRDGWTPASPPQVSREGGRLVYSDYPEFIGPSTRVHGLVHRGGDRAAIEGILYKETGKTMAADGAHHDFRVYFNHENKTDAKKTICIVATNPGSAKVRLTERARGIVVDPGDAVRAGHDALAAYEQSRRHPHPTSHTIAKHGAWAACVLGHPLPPVKGKTAAVANGIIDFSASGEVQIGVVIVNHDRAKSLEHRTTRFEFADAQHPTGDAKRTYARDKPLFNPEEPTGHVSGTFPYNAVKLTLNYDLAAGRRSAVMIGPSGALDRQYQPATDTHKVLIGNYGVQYEITIHATGDTGERAQVLLNPRGAGPHQDPTTHNKYVNAYAGVIDVPASPLPKAPLSVPAVDKVRCNDRGIGIGTATAGAKFTFGMMPPGGATLPLALVVSPAYIKEASTLTTSSGNAMATPRIIPLLAGATAAGNALC
jgi:hypothetical protein